MQNDREPAVVKQRRAKAIMQQQSDAMAMHRQLMAQDTEAIMSAVVQALIGFLSGHTTRTEVVNQLDSIKTPDVQHVVEAITRLTGAVEASKVDLTPLQADFEALKASTEAVRSSAEQQAQTAVQKLEAITAALKGIKLEAPKVTVAAPEVRVPAQDLTPLTKAMADVVKATNEVAKAVKAQKLEVNVPSTPAPEPLAERVDKSNELLQKILDRPRSSQNIWPSFQDTNGTRVPANLDASGNVKVAIQGGGGGGSGVIVDGVDSNMKANVKQSTADNTKYGLVVLNPDGSNIGGGGGGGALNTSGKGATAAGNPTSTNASADRTLLDVTLRDTSGNPVSVGGGTQYADGAAAATPTGTQLNWNEAGTQRAVSASKPLPVDLKNASVAVTGPLTDAQLRASAVPVSASSLPLPTGAATETTLSALNTKIPASPAQDRTTAASPSAVRLTDGTSFYKPTTPSDTQPVSGTVTANAGSGTFAVSAASLPLPTGAATSALQTTGNTSLSSVDTKLTDGTQKAIARGGAKGATTAADVTSTNVDANTQALDVSVKGTPSVSISGTATVSGTVTANLGTLNGVATETTLSALNTKIPASPAQDRTTAASPGAVRLSNGTSFITPTTPSDTQPISAASLPLPTGAATETTLSSINTKTPALGQTTMAGSQPVAIASNQTAIPVTDNSGSLTVDAPVGTPVFVRLSDGASAITTLPVSVAATITTKEARATASAVTSVSVTNANTSVLASNANRLGATVYNEGAAVCYLKLGATASTTSYTLQIASGGYYEVPYNYTGAIDGITSAGTAQLRVTEAS